MDLGTIAEALRPGLRSGWGTVSYKSVNEVITDVIQVCAHVGGLTPLQMDRPCATPVYPSSSTPRLAFHPQLLVFQLPHCCTINSRALQVWENCKLYNDDSAPVRLEGLSHPCPWPVAHLLKNPSLVSYRNHIPEYF